MTTNGQTVERPRRESPHNLQAEESLLACCLLASQAIVTAATIVHPSDFYKPAHAHIFAAVLDLHGIGEPVDPVTLADELSRHGMLESIGGPSTLLALQANGPAISHVARYAKIVEELAFLRSMISFAGETAELAYSTPDDVERALGAVESMMRDLRHRRSRFGRRTQPARDALGSWLDDVEHRMDNPHLLRGVETGWPDVDELTDGYPRGEVTYVYGRPGMAKTTFLLGSAVHTALVGGGQPAALFSLEVSERDVWNRIVASEARVDYGRMRNPHTLSGGDWEKINFVLPRLADAPLFVTDAAMTVAAMHAECEAIKLETGRAPVVYLDFVQKVRGEGTTREERIARVSDDLTELAKALDVPVVACASVNRGVEQRTDKRPGPSDMRDCGMLESDAGLAIGLYRDEVYNASSADQGIGEIIVGKNRNGRTGTVRLAFIGNYVRWASMARM